MGIPSTSPFIWHPHARMQMATAGLATMPLPKTCPNFRSENTYNLQCGHFYRKKEKNLDFNYDHLISLRMNYYFGRAMRRKI
jgi:hypothetical protein